jgi:hypothetical protein
MYCKIRAEFDIALETLEPVAVLKTKLILASLSGICSAAMSGSGGTLAASPYRHR